jgi:MoxR-vWA-beta-propeller ternary system domain bpX5
MLFTPSWEQREPPLPPAAVLAKGDVVPRLAQRLLNRETHQRADDLRAATSADALLIIGSAEELPWVDGVVYLGWEDGLLVPTTLRPTPPPYLLARAIERLSPTPPTLRALVPGLLFVSEYPSRAIDYDGPAGLQSLICIGTHP